MFIVTCWIIWLTWIDMVFNNGKWFIMKIGLWRHLTQQQWRLVTRVLYCLMCWTSCNFKWYQNCSSKSIWKYYHQIKLHFSNWFHFQWNFSTPPLFAWGIETCLFNNKKMILLTSALRTLFKEPTKRNHVLKIQVKYMLKSWPYNFQCKSCYF
jgi:hypothetical protein